MARSCVSTVKKIWARPIVCVVFLSVKTVTGVDEVTPLGLLIILCAKRAMTIAFKETTSWRTRLMCVRHEERLVSDE